MRPSKLILGFSIFWTCVFWIACVGVPLWNVICIGLSFDFFTDEIALWIAKATLQQALWSTGISALFGLVLGEGVGRVISGKPHSKLPLLLAIPFGVPTVVAGMAWVSWLGRNGVLAQFGIHVGWAYTLKAVILAHCFFNIPWIAFRVADARKDVPQEQLEAARTLGARSVAQFRWIIWPKIRWAYASACAQVMSFCVMSFALILILGGGPPVQTLETALYQRLHFGSIDVKGAAICAIWELILTLIPWALVLWFQKRRTNFFQARFSVSSHSHPRFLEWGLGVLLCLMILPYFSVLNAKTLKFFWDPALRIQIIKPLWISIQLAILTSFFSVLTAVFAVMSLRGRFLKAWGALFLGLPSGVSVLVLSLGFWLAYERWLDPFEGSFLAIAVVQATLFFPIAFRILWPLLQGVQTQQLEAAVTLGASSWRAFWIVEFLRWKGPLFSALAMIAGASLGEVGAASFFYSEKLIPLPLLVTRWMDHYRFDEAQGLAGILFLLSISFVVGGRKNVA